MWCTHSRINAILLLCLVLLLHVARSDDPEKTASGNVESTVAGDGESSKAETVTVEIGDSFERKKCVTAKNVASCPEDAGNKGRRLNEHIDCGGGESYGLEGEERFMDSDYMDHRYCLSEEDASFIITVEGVKVCAQRTDNPKEKRAEQLARWRKGVSEEKLNNDLEEALSNRDYHKAARVKSVLQGLEYAKSHGAGDIKSLRVEVEAAAARKEYRLAAQLKDEIISLESLDASDSYEFEGWRMNLEISCLPGAVTQETDGTPQHLVYIGDSIHGKKCVEVSNVASCREDAGNKGIRVNEDQSHAEDTFIITVEGERVCAERTDNPAEGLRKNLAAWRIDASEEKLKKDRDEAAAKGLYETAADFQDTIDGLEYARSHGIGDKVSLQKELDAAVAAANYSAAALLKAEIQGLEDMAEHVGWDMKLEIACIPKDTAAAAAESEPETPKPAQAAVPPHVSNARGSFLKAGACSFTDAATGYFYDLSALRTPRHYRFHSKYVRDGVVYSEHAMSDGYEYLINVCANVDRASLASDHLCESKADAPALQVTRSSDSYPYHQPGCFVLGMLGMSSFSLLDSAQPEKGVQLTYYGGEECTKVVEIQKDNGKIASETQVVLRSFSLNLTCDMDQGDHLSDYINLAYNALATEHETCHYSVSFPSRHACPRKLYLWSILTRTTFVVIFAIGVFAAYHVVGFSHMDWRKWGGATFKAE